ncbi:MAG: hypothetical protein KDA52_25270, partial [Planctomycetaceae bacterium]|nr:hypothetical protein [Planctomycetaceae bacterium]
LIPAGTGFRTHQNADVRIRPEALMEQKAERDRILAARRELLSESQQEMMLDDLDDMMSSMSPHTGGGSSLADLTPED